jgi:hypothetical protein
VLYNSFFCLIISVFFIIHGFGTASLHAQNPYNNLLYNYTDTNSFTKPTVEFQNLNFFKNVESFGKFFEGYTLFGYYVQGKAHFNITDKVILTGGIHLQKYFGNEGFKQAAPVYSVLWKADKSFSVRFGTIEPASFEISDLLYYSEIPLSGKPINGLSLKYRKKNIRNITWLQWDDYIFLDSPFPEVFTAGSVSRLSLYENKRHKLSGRFEFTAKHVGGQINRTDASVHTVLNGLLAADYEYKLSELSRLKLFASYTPALNSAPHKKLLYHLGHGFNSGVHARLQSYRFGLSYWYSYKWFSGDGNPLYSNISRRIEGYGQEKRALLTGHFFKRFVISDSVYAALTSEVYYDFYNHMLAYNYGFFMEIRLQKALTLPVL